jgi:hypothetical protein
MSEPIRITIDMDNKCRNCGRDGAVAENPSGLCLRCITKFFKKGRKSERRAA